MLFKGGNQGGLRGRKRLSGERNRAYDGQVNGFNSLVFYIEAGCVGIEVRAVSRNRQLIVSQILPVVPVIAQ